MLSFKRIFQTHQQAMDVYKSQLSGQHLFVESFEGASKGTQVSLTLSIVETDQLITLNANVERIMGKSEAVSLGYGTRPGLYLNVPITKEIVEPLRKFFLTQPKSARQTVKPASMPAPFAGIATCSAEEADREATQFLQNALKGNLFQLFGLRATDDRRQLRQIYNKIVKNLHPDKHRADFNDALSDKLGEAYQILNEAYKILQHSVECSIYMEISRTNHEPSGMSLNDYKKFKADYRLKNANNIHLADELVAEAENAISGGNKEEAVQHIRLALQYDRYHEAARSMQLDLGEN